MRSDDFQVGTLKQSCVSDKFVDEICVQLRRAGLDDVEADAWVVDEGVKRKKELVFDFVLGGELVGDGLDGVDKEGFGVAQEVAADERENPAGVDFVVEKSHTLLGEVLGCLLALTGWEELLDDSGDKLIVVDCEQSLQIIFFKR